MRKTIITLAVIAILLPIALYAQINYTPISAVPGISQSSLQTQGIGGYLNSIFRFAIGIGALLAVVQITIGGIQYMTSGAVGTIDRARSKIRDAIIGLLLLLSTWIILNQINPELLNFKIGQNTPAQIATNSGGVVSGS